MTATASPIATEYLDIDGVSIPVAVTRQGSAWAVVHFDTGNFGYGETRDDAMADCRKALIRDRAWFTVGAGANMILEGVFARRRSAIWTLFGDGREGR